MTRSPLLAGAVSETDAATRMGVGRVAEGALVTLAPRLAGHLFGVPEEQVTPAGVTMARLFGIRNALLGAWTLAVRDMDRDSRRLCYRVNLGVDLCDLAAVTLAFRHRGLRRFGLLGAMLAVNASLGWLDLLEETGGF